MKRFAATIILVLLITGGLMCAWNAGALSLFAPAEWKLQWAAALLALTLLLAARRGELLPASFAGWALISLTGTWIWAIHALEWYERHWLWRLALPSAAICALALFLFTRESRGVQVLRRSLLVLLVTVPVLELALRGIQKLHPTVLLSRGQLDPGAALERNRPRPGTLRFRVPCNSGGHYDAEFAIRAQEEQRVAVIGDSFSQGSVPLAWHYTTVAERALGHPVDNYGIAGIGLPEYAHILRTEVLPRDPGAIVIALFVGNDLELPPQPESRPAEAAWLDPGEVLVRLLPTRLQRIAGERERNNGRVAQVAGVSGETGGIDVELYPWLDNPALELPTISREGFLRLEEERARSLAAWSAEQALELARRLDLMREDCAGRRFLVMLIPDEYQVEDGLFRIVEERLGRNLERDWPQRLLKSALDARGIEVLDLLPLMLASQPSQDGSRHLYHLQDTHWNARGNALAGKALAERLRR